MNRATMLTLAVALPVVAVATIGTTTSAASPTSEPSSGVAATRAPATFPPPSGEVPSGWTELVDDTGTLGISVPSTWAATDVSPAVDDKGLPRPMISATTDEALFVPPEGTPDAYSVPGLIYYAVPMQPITPARLEASAFAEECTAGPIESYDDGAYVGYLRSFDACGGTASRIVELVANPRLGSVTVVLLVQLTGQPDDAATLDGLLSGFVDYSGFDAATMDLLGSTTPALDSGPLAAIQQLVHGRFGLSITADQASCLVNDATGLGPPSEPATLVTLDNCGVDVLDIPGG
jgi:hypothetical protein